MDGVIIEAISTGVGVVAVVGSGLGFAIRQIGKKFDKTDKKIDNVRDEVKQVKVSVREDMKDIRGHVEDCSKRTATIEGFLMNNFKQH